MADTKNPVQLRLLSLELLKQLWAGHEAMCRSVARAASEVGGHLGNAQVSRKRRLIPSDYVQASRVNLSRRTHFMDGAKLRPWREGTGLGYPKASHSGVKTNRSTAGQGGWAQARLRPG